MVRKLQAVIFRAEKVLRDLVNTSVIDINLAQLFAA